MKSAKSDNLIQKKNISQLILAFVVATILLAAHDLIKLSWGDDLHFETSISLLFFGIRLLVELPCFVGLVVLLGVQVHGVLPKRIGGFKLARGVLSGIIAMMSLIEIGPLFSGPAIVDSFFRLPLIGLSLLGIGVAVYVFQGVISVGSQKFKFLNRRQKSGAAVGLSVLVCSIILGVSALSKTIFPGLYMPFHRLLTLLALAMCGGAVFLVISLELGYSGDNSRWHLKVFALVLVGLFFISCPLGIGLTRYNPIARQLVVERAIFFGPFVSTSYALESRFLGAFRQITTEETLQKPSDFSAAQFKTGAKKSVVFITVDALRGDVLSENSSKEVLAKQLLQLSKKAIYYTAAYVPGNKTGISLPSILLGYPTILGHSPDENECFVSGFNRAGYNTRLYYTMHHCAATDKMALRFLASKGFYFESYFTAPSDAETVFSKIETALKNATKPIFVWAHVSDVHKSFRECNAAVKKKGLESYSARVKSMDSLLGAFIKAITAANDQLVWAISADHGEALKHDDAIGHGFALSDEQIRVPLLIGGAGIVPAKISSPVGNVHIGRTLLKLAGATVDASKGILPLENQVEFSPGAEPTLILGNTMCGVVSGQWKLVADKSTGVLALYNLKEDPEEIRNVLLDNNELAGVLMDKMQTLGCPFSPTSL